MTFVIDYKKKGVFELKVEVTLNLKPPSNIVRL